MRLLERFRLYLAARAELKHQRWLKKGRVIRGLPRPDPRTVVHNTKEGPR